eukprot:3603169-Amphidinium_carterae.1
MPGPLWIVVGGNDARGIIVRHSYELASSILGRLCKAAIVEEIEVVNGRLHFAKVTGDGPAYGWASVCLSSGKVLMARLWNACGEDGKTLKVLSDPSDEQSTCDIGLASAASVLEL